MGDLSVPGDRWIEKEIPREAELYTEPLTHRETALNCVPVGFCLGTDFFGWAELEAKDVVQVSMPTEGVRAQLPREQPGGQCQNTAAASAGF